ncbi:HAMP domain-containing sensor histidine kinase [Sulfurimonas sp.]|uniref:sensor histidine kinase n=1 Tax=Sulfurimonas sp. TaxID=2022749 RepID=UPI0025F1EFC2|nr:HAMP domain-containing sensor histidine kinase [Sulfurimonas sp.]MDD5158154.1 HAMP domain-containing sensor histidine kinase [Sulfurimonas sp.]
MNQFLGYLKPILAIADRNTDSEELKRAHGFLIYLGLLMSTGGLLWGTICLANGLYIPAVVPFTYITITIVNFTYLFISKNFIASQIIQILISLLLPFLFQFFLGGFVASGGNVLWSVLAVFGSFTLQKKRMTLLWLILFILLIILSGFVDSYAKQFDIGLSEAYSIFFFVINFILTISIIFSLYYYFVSNEEKAREELQKSLKQLNQAQGQLIESEKMASLGTLVSGVAHEINTPLGVALTGISQITHEVKKLETNYKNEMLTEEALNEYIATMKQLTQTINDRLNNAALLVKSFKHISVDQHFEDKREFHLKKYIDDLFLGLQNLIKSKRVQIVNTIDETLVLESYPGIFSQIFSNLILNSIKHGFEQNTENIIKISVELNDYLIIHYQDNGVGVTDEIEKKIFDPFFTTKRGEGGSGLGLNVVYNLITQKLKGKLSLVRVLPHGLGLTIILDKEIILKV